MNSLYTFAHLDKMNQGHGKTWETDIGMNVYKATELELNSVSHTAPIDIPCEFNRLDGVDVSIKTSCGDAIDMGDILRTFDKVGSGDKFHMTVVTWRQKNATTKILTRVTEVDLTNARHILFGAVTRQEIEELVSYVKSVPYYGRTKEHQATYKRMSSKLKEIHGGWMSYAPKVDSATQRRVQGRFCNFRKFLTEFPMRVVAESDCGAFRGGQIADEIASTRRIRSNRLI